MVVKKVLSLESQHKKNQKILNAAAEIAKNLAAAAAVVIKRRN